MLESQVRDHGSRQKWATAHGVPVRAVGMALDRKRNLPDSIINALGYLVVETYEPIGRTPRASEGKRRG